MYLSQWENGRAFSSQGILPKILENQEILIPENWGNLSTRKSKIQKVLEKSGKISCQSEKVGTTVPDPQKCRIKFT